MHTNKIILSYRGEISQDITKALLGLTERELEKTGAGVSLKKRVFNVMIECLQNITKHGEKDRYSGASLVMIGRNKNGYQILSGNVMTRKNVTSLQEKLLQLNQMNPNEVKSLYKNVLRSVDLEDRERAGLGLIDIARKTGNAIFFGFEPINEDFSYFSLGTQISTNG